MESIPITSYILSCSGIQLPEGVDPSFLAALPEGIRQEVLREHLGIRHSRHPPPPSGVTTAGPSAPVTTAAPLVVGSSTPSTSALDPNSSISQVNPEFLAALPLHIQDEVSVCVCV